LQRSDGVVALDLTCQHDADLAVSGHNLGRVAGRLFVAYENVLDVVCWNISS